MFESVAAPIPYRLFIISVRDTRTSHSAQSLNGNLKSPKNLWVGLNNNSPQT